MPDPTYRIEPFFLESPRGLLFCLFLAPNGSPPKAAVLYLHPFAEEMHKSRRMAASQARALAAKGYAVLQVDLTGCGDSAGDFGDASWSAWLNDACLALDWLSNTTRRPIFLWGLRTGALLAAQIAHAFRSVQHLLLWQPVNDGSAFLNQFLRIKLASEMLSEGQSKTGTKDLLGRLQAGHDVEVGGYMLSPDMARELGGLRLAAMPPPCKVSWLEVGAEASTNITPASRRASDAWQQSGTVVQAQTVKGDPFWATQEIAECPDLIRATLEALSS